jgi:hypothetical protein
MTEPELDRKLIIVVNPRRLKETAAWIVENLLEEEYPGIDHWPHSKEQTKLEHYTKEQWEEISWFDHYDTTTKSSHHPKTPTTMIVTPTGYERTERAYHLIFTDKQAWLMLKLLQ